MATLLIVSPYFWPGLRGGGPIRSLLAMIPLLSTEVRVLVVTRDHDLGDKSPYPSVKRKAWHVFEGAKVWYAGRTCAYVLKCGGAAWSLPVDVVYLNSVFDLATLPVLAIARLRSRRKSVASGVCVIAPRGELSPGAMALKARKKRAYLKVGTICGLFDHVIWHASTPLEADEIRAVLTMYGLDAPAVGVGCVDVQVARDEVAVSDERTTEVSTAKGSVCHSRASKTPGVLRVVFVSRIVPKKNLDFAIRLLNRTALADSAYQLEFDIYGPVEDAKYWKACSSLASRTPENLSIRYRGVLDPSNIPGVLGRYHALLLPTLAENFGHVIFEALSAHLPVVVSDQTPWRLDLATGGWSLRLSDGHAWETALHTLVAMDGLELDRLRSACAAGLGQLGNIQPASAFLRAICLSGRPE